MQNQVLIPCSSYFLRRPQKECYRFTCLVHLIYQLSSQTSCQNRIPSWVFQSCQLYSQGNRYLVVGNCKFFSQFFLHHFLQMIQSPSSQLCVWQSHIYLHKFLVQGFSKQPYLARKTLIFQIESFLEYRCQLSRVRHKCLVQECQYFISQFKGVILQTRN